MVGLGSYHEFQHKNEPYVRVLSASFDVPLQLMRVELLMVKKLLIMKNNPYIVRNNVK